MHAPLQPPFDVASAFCFVQVGEAGAPDDFGALCMAYELLQLDILIEETGVRSEVGCPSETRPSSLTLGLRPPVPSRRRGSNPEILTSPMKPPLRGIRKRSNSDVGAPERFLQMPQRNVSG